MIAIICTDGQLTVDNIQYECAKQSWIPILTLREKSTNDILVPIFDLEDICKRFISRNLPLNWKKGCVYLTVDDAKKMISNGWKLFPLDFPRKFNDHPNFTMGFEIHEFVEEPDFKAK